MRCSKDSHLLSSTLRRLSWSCCQPVLQCLLLFLCLLSHALVDSAPVNARRERRTTTKTEATICGTIFTDTASSALLADVVLEGRVRQKITPQGDNAPAPGVRYNVTIQVRKQVWKGRELVNKGKKARKLTVGTFLSLPSRDTVTIVSDDKDDTVVMDSGVSVGDGGVGQGMGDCVADVTEGATYIFFLRDVGHKRGRYFAISALPVKKSRRLSRIVSKILKDNGAKKPSIQRLKGPRSVKTGSSLTLRCKAKAKPNPTFTWYKDGVEIVSKRGLRIKNSKRGSRLKISKTDKTTEGVYTCEAANAVGEASKNVTIKVRGSKLSDQSYNFYEYMNEDANATDWLSVTAPEHIHIACQKQTFCFNGGTCRYIPDLHQTFCQCPKEWAGHRCEILDLYGPGNKNELREAKLEFERVLIIVGIVIALLVFVVICIASYFLANRRRKRWEARRRMKRSLGPESDLLLDKTDGGAQLTRFSPSYKPLAQKETQTDLDFRPPAYPPKPDLEPQPNLTHALPNNPGNIFLQDGSFPPITRTAATTTAAPPPKSSSQRPARPMSDIESGDVERNGLRCRLKAVSVNDTSSDRPESWKAVNQVPDSKSMPVIMDGEGDLSDIMDMTTLSSQPVSSSSPRLNPHDEVDALSHNLTAEDCPQLMAVPVSMETPAPGNARDHPQLSEDGPVPEQPLSEYPAPENPAFNHPASEYPQSECPAQLPPDYGFLESNDFLPKVTKSSGPLDVLENESLPVNGVLEDWESDDEVPDKPLLPLHISEEDLNGNMPKTDSFDLESMSPPPPPPPEPFTEYPSPSLSSLSPVDSMSAYRPKHLPPMEPPRPGSVSEDDSAGFLPHTLSSTEASSPLTEGTPQGETYAFDPCMDSDPNEFEEQFMHGSPKKGAGPYKAVGDQDYERRLRDVCADQDAIPI